jgi:uncharacterized protein YndB with AHSA1/START domain
MLKDKILKKSEIIPAPVAEVWKAWTTSEGAATFFAPKANIELRLGGPFEILFDLDVSPGNRGSEGCTVLSFLPLEMLSFTWNAPPEMPNARKQFAFVVVRLAEVDANQTRVDLNHLGWGEGEEWERAYLYFDRAWALVMGWLKDRFTTGPIDWNCKPVGEVPCAR